MRTGFLNKVPFAPVVGALFGVVAGILVIATPLWLFESAIAATGLPQLVSAAEPPLGNKARIMAIILAVAIVGGAVWLCLAALERMTAKRPIASVEPEETREILQIEAPRPIFAESDLGAPFMSDEAMAHARDELLLDNAVLEEEADVVDVRSLSFGSEPLVEPSAGDTVKSLLDRLESALERRKARGSDGAPTPGDIGSLRTALGIAA